ncbi:subclass B3 metallo-beta-lactamase [Paludibaculum fermentans]|uniref:Subclass B3 metallo-beta-lactamase n=1 Tax=Paludibaculum fermentans TaxID=1473598 RepID=A0A7S7NXG8_PALFE|nr:subclass B3 metallo-beta-lactamase [Paludibaculum fermentans]QOY91592.1 subclass B3 metallo-beta-lactamase [Paludibaculum fermentans]
MRFLLTALLFLPLLLADQNPGWKKPFPAHRIAGNIYYVGTEDLACFLITNPEGHILINTGLADSTPLLRQSIEKLGFQLKDVKILLNMQAHFDHVAAMEEVRKLTGAKVYATEADAPIMEDGGHSDPAFGPEAYFTPIHVDRRIKDGEVIKLGATALTVITTPGHSRGSVTYTMTVDDNGRKRAVAFANMGTVVMPLLGNPKYPNIAADLEQSFAKQQRMKPEIWVAAHASQYDMEKKVKAGSFVDPQGYKAAIDQYEKSFHQQLAQAKAKAGSSH